MLQFNGKAKKTPTQMCCIRLKAAELDGEKASNFSLLLKGKLECAPASVNEYGKTYEDCFVTARDNTTLFVTKSDDHKCHMHFAG